MEIAGFAVIILVMIIVIVRRQYIKTKMDTQKKLEMAANQLQLQIEEVADTVIGRMENRINHLEMLIDDADDKINVLDQKLQAFQEMKEKSIAAAEENSQRTKTIARASMEVAAPVSIKPVRKQPEQHLSEANKAVLELLANGNSLDEIAKRTGMGKGAILLIRELYK